MVDRARRLAVGGVWWWRAHRFIDRAGPTSSTAMLIGSARSGTTWLGELIDRHRDHRILFEPFRPGVVPALQAFDATRYLRPGDGDAAQRDAAAAVLEGRLRNPWVDHTSSARLPRRRLLKDVRINCLSPWLAAEFPASPLVLIARHPVDVAMSRLALGWRDSLDELLSDADLVYDHVPADLRDHLSSLTDPAVRALAQWSIETIVPLRLLAPDQVLFVHYEELRRQPLATATEVLRYVGQEPDDALAAAVDKPSRTTQQSGISGTGTTRARLDGAQERQGRRVLAEFGLDTVYDIASPTPDVDGGRALLAARFQPPARSG